MKVRYWFAVFMALILGACGSQAVSQTPSASNTASITLEPTMPLPQVGVTSVPSIQEAASTFLELWKAEDYSKLYDLISESTKSTLTIDSFSQTYSDVATKLTLQSLDYEILSTMTNPTTAQAKYRVTFHTAVLEDIQREMTMNLVLENGSWHVQWDPTLIMPELQNGQHLEIEIDTPTRGVIYDRNGNVIAADSDAVALGVVPQDIPTSMESTVLVNLSILTGKTWQDILAMYQYATPSQYVAIGTAPYSEVEKHYQVLSGLEGLVMSDYSSRYYYSGVAAQSIGYVSAIPKEELDQYLRKGYNYGDRVGRTGLESWGESYLAGKRGVKIYVVDAQGQIVNRLSETSPTPGQDLYTTLDSDFQTGVQNSISAFRGAVVVMERDTGRILAIASSPSFDPNLFDANNPNQQALYQYEIASRTDQPELNRATLGSYPLGSVFKVITMASALESKLYTKDTTYDCQYEFTELPGQIYYDWTYDYHGKQLSPSGVLTLPEGLMRSCNPYFQHIGLDLYQHNFPTLIADTARGFGLGQPTGIGEIDEVSGSITNPATDGDATQIAIGQGTMLVTPLQVARFIAAVGNGGTLYRPQLVEKIVNQDGSLTFEFQPQAMGSLPVSAENLKIIQAAMFSVIESDRGTAHRAFLNFQIPTYGKTGTATTSVEEPHAWFGAYTDAKNPNKPDIAVAVIAENVGQGSDFAAPICRRVIELYFYGQPMQLFDWESDYYMTRTPTEIPTNTPIPEVVIPQVETPTETLTP